MVVKSITPLSDNELNRIREILHDAKDPNKTLIETFPTAYNHMDIEGQGFTSGAILMITLTRFIL